MTFKDTISRDLSVFFLDFAEMRNIDGQQMLTVIDTDLLKAYPRQSFDGIYVEEIVLFVRLNDLGERPVTEQRLYVDEELYTVRNCTESAGMLEITLEANRA